MAEMSSITFNVSQILVNMPIDTVIIIEIIRQATKQRFVDQLNGLNVLT